MSVEGGPVVHSFVILLLSSTLPSSNPGGPVHHEFEPIHSSSTQPTAINRRDFLRKSVGITGVAALASSSSSVLKASSAKDDLLNGSDKKLGFALVGLGNYSKSMLGPALKETRNCYLSGIVTGTPSKAKQWSQEYGLDAANVYNYQNYDAIAENDDIDVIYVVLPNSMHAEFTIRALEAGKHVICEKPMGLTAAECEEMIAVAEKCNRKLAVGYRMHYDPYFVEVNRICQTEEYGPVNYMEAALGYSYTPTPGHWRTQKDMGGSVLYNLGVYPIQSVRHAKGSDPLYVTAQSKIKRPEHFPEVPEMFTWQLEWADATMASCFTGTNALIDRLYVGCRDGWLNMQPCSFYGGQACETSRGKMNYPQVFQQKLQMEDFARCVLDDQPCIVSGEEGLRDARIIDAIHESIRTGGRVKIG